VFYTASRLLPMTTGVALWMWLRDGTVADPANLLLLFSLATGVLGLAAVRRYWVVRSTSRSRRDSSLLASRS
jgi:hypothetical protein